MWVCLVSLSVWFSMSPGGVRVCDCVWRWLLSCLSGWVYPKGWLTVCHMYTHTIPHTILHIRGWEVPSVPGTWSPTTGVHTHRHINLPAYFTHFFLCSVWTSSESCTVYFFNMCLCSWYDRNFLGLVPMRELLYIYIWSVRTELSSSLISLITHTIPTIHTHTSLLPVHTH